MALLNRNFKRKHADRIQLAEERDRILVEFPEEEDDGFDTKSEIFKHHGITLWISDAVILVLEHFQYFALMLALSVRWGWPASFIKNTHFTLLLNFDAWQFWMVQSGLFNRSTSDFVSSKDMDFNYTSYLAAWATMVCLIAGVFLIVLVLWTRKRPLYLLLYLARLKRVFFYVVQILALPFGIAVARIFHCRPNSDHTAIVMDVQNEVVCYTFFHLGLLALVSVMCIGIYVIYPLILMRIIGEQVFAVNQERHEGYLQLKEAEYEQGLDILWYVGQFYLFSSFKRVWIYFNPMKIIFKFLLCVAFAASMHYMFWSTAAMTFLFFSAAVALAVKKAFRVSAFNLIVFLGYLSLGINALLGNLHSVPPWEDASKFVVVSFLRHPKITYLLLATNGTFVAFMALWVIYLVSKEHELIGNKPLWPKLSFDNENYVADETKKYMQAALQGRHTLEKALSSIPIFAPVHELSRQVQVINAYCRETEFLNYPIHDTLWDLLDELIEAHNALAPVSVFGTSGKQSLRKTAKEFLGLMPQFCKRLQQRDYDLILVPRFKKRLLLKMYVLGVFVNGRAEKSGAGKKVEAALKRHNDQSFSFYESYDDVDSYRESTIDSAYLIDEPESRPATSGTIDEDGSHSRSVARFLEEMESWTREHPRQESSAGNRKLPAISDVTKGYQFGSQSSMSLPGQISDEEDGAGSPPQVAVTPVLGHPSNENA